MAGSRVRRSITLWRHLQGEFVRTLIETIVENHSMCAIDMFLRHWLVDGGNIAVRKRESTMHTPTRTHGG